MPPETFARVASGVALVRPAGCQGEAAGGSAATGFLIGSQVLVTAYEVAADASARGCGLQVLLGGGSYSARSAKAWHDAHSKARDVGLATVDLDRPAPGYNFRFARTLPGRDSSVATLGHPLGLPLSFQQGLFRRAGVSAGVRILSAWIVAEGGNRGGPIIDANGDVIAIVTRTSVSEEDALNATNFVGEGGVVSGASGRGRPRLPG